MIEKTIEGLAKAASGLSQHFKKAAVHHKSVSETHTALAEAHKAHGEFCKAKHEAMDDGDVHKTYFGKCAALHAAKAAHHLTKSALHKAHAEHLDGLADSFGAEPEAVKVAAVKAADNDGKGVEELIQKTTDSLVTKALEALNNDPKVAERIQEIVLNRVNAALGDKMVPDHVRGVISDRPGIRLVPRPGDAPISTEGVDAKLQKFVEA